MEPEIRQILGLPLLNHDNQPPNTKRRRQAASAQNRYNAKLLHPGHLQRPQHRDGENQNIDIAGDAYCGVGGDDLLLVDAGSVRGTVPVCGDGAAEEELDEESWDVVEEEDYEADVDYDDFAAIWGEDAEHDGEEGEFYGEDHWDVD